MTTKMTEPEDLKIGPIVLVGMIAVVTFVLAGIWAGWMFSTEKAALQPDGPPSTPSLRRAEVGIVNQHPFTVDDRAAVTRESQMNRLQSYGWVDRDAGTVHIPIGTAMDALVKENAQ